jgi:hypothetical protein
MEDTVAVLKEALKQVSKVFLTMSFARYGTQLSVMTTQVRLSNQHFLCFAAWISWRSLSCRSPGSVTVASASLTLSVRLESLRLCLIVIIVLN